jgi:hypothetical protein
MEGLAMGQLDHAALKLQRAMLKNSDRQSVASWQHVPDYALMPYELAEIEECSLSLEEAIGKGDDDVAAAMCQWHTGYP